MDAVMAAWAIEVGLITVRDLSGPRRLPLPSELLATFVVFGGLGLLRGSTTARGAAGATAWGIVVATLLGSRVDILKPVADFFTGAGPTGLAASPPTAPPIGATPVNIAPAGEHGPQRAF